MNLLPITAKGYLFFLSSSHCLIQSRVLIKSDNTLHWLMQSQYMDKINQAHSSFYSPAYTSFSSLAIVGISEI